MLSDNVLVGISVVPIKERISDPIIKQLDEAIDWIGEVWQIIEDKRGMEISVMFKKKDGSNLFLERAFKPEHLAHIIEDQK